MDFLFPYLLIINAAGFFSMLADKGKAKKNLRRTPERTLLLIALFGGSLGSLLGMYLFRHKTQKPKFTLGVPLILAVQVVLAITVFLSFS